MIQKLLGAATALSLMAGVSAFAADYPEREVLGVVMWGAGGATDTVARAVNPAAEDDPDSPIAGMPVLKVWEAGSVMMIKRSLSPGFAGIKNKLFEAPNNMMVFGDAKKILQEMVAELKALA